MRCLAWNADWSAFLASRARPILRFSTAKSCRGWGIELGITKPAWARVWCHKDGLKNGSEEKRYASAQSYPERPVRVLIAFPAGGTIDTLGRIIAQKLTQAWGQNVVIENRPGAGGNIGGAAAAKSAPDGYTLHLGAQTLAVNVTLQPSTEFDPVKDFDPIMLVATAQDVLLMPPNSPFRSVKELIDYAKAHPGELNYASLGTGTSGHLAT